MQRFLVVAGLVACGSSSPGPTPPPPPSPAVVELAPITDRDVRCRAVFDLFRRDVHPNITAPEAARLIRDRAWIVVDDPITVLGGEIPIELTDEDSDVVVHCDARPTPELNGALWSDWVIYMRISGHTAPTFKAFLAAGSDVRLIEYALMSPDGKIQRFR